MELLELYQRTPEFLEGKRLQQIIAMEGNGNLLTPSTSAALRRFLHVIPSQRSSVFAGETLTEKFKNSGFALQDLVNEAGRRLDFQVQPGVYQGRRGQIGFDGLWKTADGYSIVVEVKTTDTYNFSLEKIDAYKVRLIQAGEIDPERSSVLLVVGRQNTGSLEAQIRGSRYARNMRLVSVDALFRLLQTKENFNDAATIHKIYEILKPLEYTRVDALVDTVFFTMQDMGLEETPEELDEPAAIRITANFYAPCLERLQRRLGQPLLKAGRISYQTADDRTGLVLALSNPHSSGQRISFWFAYHLHQRAYLSQFSDAYMAFGCGMPEVLFLVPAAQLNQWTQHMSTTQKNGRMYWHVKLYEESPGHYELHLTGGQTVDMDPYRV